MLGYSWGTSNEIYTSVRLAHYLLLLCCSFAPSYAASPPMPFDRWNNQGGTIQVACPAGYTCTENVVSDNMIQRILTRNNSGETYVHVIIDDSSNGQHQSETFVNASNDSGTSIPLTPVDELGVIIPVIPTFGGDTIEELNISSVNTGIATKMTINQTGVATGTTATPTTMNYSYVLNTGWAINPNQPTFELQHHITNTTPQGIFFDYVFDYTQHRNAANRVTGWLYGINQFVRNSAVIGPGNGGTADDHRFVLRRASGDFITGGSATLPPSAGGGMGGMGGAAGVNPADGAGAPPAGTIIPNPQATPFPNPPGAPTGNPAGMGGGGGVPPGGTVAWNTGDEVQVIWIGQVCPGCMIGMGGMGMMGGSGSFGFQQYENITNGQMAASRTIAGTAPFTWTNPPFGPQPGL